MTTIYFLRHRGTKKKTIHTFSSIHSSNGSASGLILLCKHNWIMTMNVTRNTVNNCLIYALLNVLIVGTHFSTHAFNCSWFPALQHSPNRFSCSKLSHWGRQKWAREREKKWQKLVVLAPWHDLRIRSSFRLFRSQSNPQRVQLLTESAACNQNICVILHTTRKHSWLEINVMNYGSQSKL